MALVSMSTVAPGDTITSAQHNIITSNITLLDSRTGGDPGAASKLLEASGTLSGGWITPTVTDTTAPAADSGSISTVLSNIGYQLKAIIGGAGWKTAVGSSLTSLASSVTTLTASIATKVAKGGDTMTGLLTISSGGLTVSSGSVAISAGNLNIAVGSTTGASGDFTELKRNGSVVWAASNDGSGSGLDADLLDGAHAAGFLDTTSAAQSIGVTKTLTLDGGATMRLGNAGSGANPDVTVFGKFTATGTKSASVRDRNGDLHLFYCLEAPVSYFEDFGEAALVGGEAFVPVPADFAEFVVVEGYQVAITPYGDADLYVEARDDEGFTVRARSGDLACRFGWRLTALRADVPAERLKLIGPIPVENEES